MYFGVFNSTGILFELVSMDIFYVISICFFLFELEITGNTFNSFAEMDYFNMSIQMMFVAEWHTALSAVEILYIGMRYHVAFKVRGSFEGLTAILLFAGIIPFGSMPLSHVTIEVRQFFEELVADLASLMALL